MATVAVKETELPAHTGLEDGATEMAAARTGFTVMVKIPEVEGLPVAQVAFEVSSQVIRSLLAGKQVKIEVPVPALVPLTFHWYNGTVPPLMVVAVMDIGIPAQTGLTEGAIETLTGRFGLTVMVMGAEVYGLPAAQTTSEVRVQVTMSRFTGVQVNTGPFKPTAPPLTFH